MDKIRVLHTGDLHIDTSFFTTETKADILKYELLEGFVKITEIAVERKVDALIIAGDITDNGVLSKSAYDIFYKELSELNIPVIMILGNHDTGFNYDLPKNVHLLNAAEKVTVKGADIYGGDVKGFKPKHSDRINIMVQHGTVGDDIAVSDIAKSGFSYLALGHIHKSEGLKKAGDTFYAYCGVPIGRGFDEQGQKGVIIADIEKNNVTAELVPVAKRQYLEYNIDVTDCDDYIKVLEKTKDLDKNNLYKFILTGSPCGYIDLSALKSVINDRFFYCKVIDKTHEEVDITTITKEESLRGYLINSIISKGGGSNSIKYGLSALKGERIYIDEN